MLILWGRLFECSRLPRDVGSPFGKPQVSVQGRCARANTAVTGLATADRLFPNAGRVRRLRAPVKTCQSATRRPSPFLRRYTVFNVDQCDNLPDHCPSSSRRPALEREIVPQAEALAVATARRYPHRWRGRLLAIGRYRSHSAAAGCLCEINYCRTLFHELGHWILAIRAVWTGPSRRHSARTLCQ